MIFFEVVVSQQWNLGEGRDLSYNYIIINHIFYIMTTVHHKSALHRLPPSNLKKMHYLEFCFRMVRKNKYLLLTLQGTANRWRRVLKWGQIKPSFQPNHQTLDPIASSNFYTKARKLATSKFFTTFGCLWISASWPDLTNHSSFKVSC